eukprot:CAMPEP_0201616198 /NCGR_PEP_ID=MMETSP0492-20130828/33297_1 /ASSEMBLY_ACC=CAM_ASM_000837 /TAXON_ID=420259 /ORGANISM="Thalassiosira gravida, Strain GMp14c1" /LENGTH=110 /DNA_ID=CAMNT_0048084075 /DNA_START=13 /DNA_END=342 /DNA_ORIENTATION=+
MSWRMAMAGGEWYNDAQPIINFCNQTHNGFIMYRTKRPSASRLMPSINNPFTNISVALLTTFLFLLSAPTSTNAAPCVNAVNVCDGDGPTNRPTGGCYEYARCFNGKPTE